MSGFEAAYRERLIPILKRHGLVKSPLRGRATPDSIFSRLFEVETPSGIPEMQKALLQDAALEEALREAGAGFLVTPGGSPIRLTFRVYAAPAGPGRVVPAGPGKVVPAGRGRGHWRTYGVTDGLADVSVRSIFQDQEGRLWFVTYGGVSRFDGQGFTTFTTQDGLADNTVRTGLLGREGYCWFGTEKGVSRFDGREFTTLSTGGLANRYVRLIYQDRDGNLWLGTERGVTRYDGQSFTTFTTRQGLANNEVSAIFQDREGYLWFGSDGGGVSRYDGKGFTTFTVRDGLANNAVNAIFQDREGGLWFGTYGGGVSRYDGKGFTTFTTRDGLANNAVNAIFQDREGYLWFGTSGGGVSRYDGKGFATFTVRDGLANDNVQSIFQDREGLFWFGTQGGVSRYDDEMFAAFTSGDGLGHDVVLSILEDRKGNLWFGTQWGGVTRYDGKTFTTFTTKDGLAHDQVRTIFEDRDGNLWFGTREGGVTRYDGKTFATFTTQDGLGDNGVWAICQDRGGNLWFGTYEHTVTRYDSRTWTTFAAEDGLPDSWIWSILEDRDGYLWFSTQGGGVSRFDGKTHSAGSGQAFTTFTTQDGLASNRIFSILQDRAGGLWFGTEGGGVSLHDGKTFTTFTVRDGLGHNVVRSVFQDRKGDLWFGTFGGGVTRYDGKAFTTLTTQDGIVHNQVVAILQDRKGDLWFGTEAGVTRYRPPNPFPPPVSIDAVVADRRYERVSQLAIPSTADLTAFEFRAVSLKTRPEQMVYRYRLKGYDGDWTSTHARRVEYHDLPRGTYTFEVQAVDRDLVYSETPATVTLTVHLPYAQMGLILALGIAGALVAWQAGRVVQRDRRLRKSNEDLRREMTERQRAEEERARLDAQLQHMRYLYRLRTALGAASSPEEVIRQAGAALMEALSPATAASAVIQHGGRTWEFGATDDFGFGILDFGLEASKGSNRKSEIQNLKSGGVRYERGLVWGERERGRLTLFSGMKLSEAQERALLDETAAQVARALEAQELEMQLLQSARLVSLGQMAAGVAHELNQPLTALSATAGDIYLRLVEDLRLPPEHLKEMMRDVLDMIRRMSGTVDHMRVFSRDTAQEPGVPFSVNEVIRSGLRLIEAQLKSHGIGVRLDLSEGLPPVSGNPHQMEQVFLNLLGNARDALDEKAGYRESGTVDRKNQALSQVGGDGTDHESRTTDHEPRGWEKGLWIRTRCETIGGDRWVVAEVEDNGAGIDEAHIGRVFEPFFTTKPADRGTGLGLSISYAIVRNHGGQIACESRKGEGTVFRVILPAAKEGE